MRSKAILAAMLVASMACGQSMYERLHMMRANRSLAWTPAGLDVGLVSYWAMRTNSATTVWDEYDTNTGTAVNGVLFGSAYGKRDAGAGLNGTIHYINMGSSDVFDFSETNSVFTVSTWVKGTEVIPNNLACSIISKGNQATLAAGWKLIQVGFSGAQYWQLKTGNGTIFTSATAAKTTTNFAHLVGIKTTTNVSIYVDGILIHSSTNAIQIANTSADLHIGSAGSTATEYFEGSVDEVAIWSRALTSTEVYQLYSQPIYKPYRSN